ncbi:MAG TPA: DNA-3-methyladenine glycosylase 2 family protein [Microlunatus sp.]
MRGQPVAGPQAPQLIDRTVTTQDHRDRRVTLDQPVPIDPLIGAHRRGPGDPTHRRLGPGHWLRASRTPEGPVLLRLTGVGTAVSARAWGEGADWALAQLPRLLGTDDDPTGFVPRPDHGALVLAHRRHSELRIGRSELVWESLAPACLEQVVTGKEAFRAFRLLVTEFGELAPGPATDPASAAYGMRVPPPAEVWARIPTWRFLAAGVEQRRSATLVRAAGRARALERTLAGENAAADRALRSLPGVGPWTSAEVRQRAHGDPDAWSIHDYHVAKDITYALVGEALDDAACLEILEPYRGHRYRVQLLLSLSAARRPRRGPRMTLPTHTPYATKGRS